MSTFIPVWFEVTALAILVAILIADLLLILVRPRIPRVKESILWVTFYVLMALCFSLALLLVSGHSHVMNEFLAGWLTEYSLSIDNLFVFVLLMRQFAVPRPQQQKVLIVGIIIALLLRAVFILIGGALIEKISWIFYIFGLFLVWTAWRQAFSHNVEPDPNNESRFIRFARRVIPVSNTYDAGKLRIVENGKKVWTPLVLVIVALGVTDLIFAIDSIPAIFGITQDAFLVFTANLFALMGLRQLYFLLGNLLERLAYLHYGIAFILAFIGVKLFFHALAKNDVFFINGGNPVAWAPDISTGFSLLVILAAMVVATGASLIASRPGSQKK